MDARVRIDPPNPDTMVDQIKSMCPGQAMVYHTGFLHEDRQFNVPVSRRAETAWRAKEQGLVFLFQRRGLNGCDYILVRRRAK